MAAPARLGLGGPVRLDHSYFETRFAPCSGRSCSRRAGSRTRAGRSARGGREDHRDAPRRDLLARGWLFEPELAARSRSRPGSDMWICPPSTRPGGAAAVAARGCAPDVRHPRPVRGLGCIEVAVGDPSDIDVEALERVLGRSVESSSASARRSRTPGVTRLALNERNPPTARGRRTFDLVGAGRSLEREVGRRIVRLIRNRVRSPRRHAQHSVRLANGVS